MDPIAFEEGGTDGRNGSIDFCGMVDFLGSAVMRSVPCVDRGD
jgi:hypothetical protein